MVDETLHRANIGGFSNREDLLCTDTRIRGHTVRVKIECVDHPRVDSVGKGSCQLMPKLLLPR